MPDRIKQQAFKFSTHVFTDVQIIVAVKLALTRINIHSKEIYPKVPEAIKNRRCPINVVQGPRHGIAPPRKSIIALPPKAINLGFRDFPLRVQFAQTLSFVIQLKAMFNRGFYASRIPQVSL